MCRTRALSLVFVLSLLAALALLPRTASAAPPCPDADHDGLTTCEGDCDDGDPTVGPGLEEICDGKDNDCDGTVDETSSIKCGLGACEHFAPRCVDGVPQTCDPMEGAAPEVCDGVDNDCDGAVDDGPGADQDADGYTTFCDCDDADPASHPLADELCQDGRDQDCNGVVDDLLIDSGGRGFCIDIQPIRAPVESAASATVDAYHVDGVSSILVTEENGQPQTYACGGVTLCTVAVSVGDYDASRALKVELKKAPGGITAGSLSRVVPYICEREHCSPDPEITAFTTWMRGKGYADCVVDKYIGWSNDLTGHTNVLERNLQKYFLRVRGTPNLVQPLAVDFYDVVPTDADTTYLSLGAGEGGNCKKSFVWADFCPNPVTADYLFAERHLERSYGLDLAFNYIRLDLNYEQNSIPFTYDEISKRYNFTIPSDFNTDHGIADRSIVHFAIETFRGARVKDFGNGFWGTANTTFEPDVAGSQGAGSYSHEWGHTWGYPHSFFGISQFGWLPDSEFIALDGVMDNSYREDTSLTDPTDPLERYGLEPPYPGYTDDATFAASYSTAITGTRLLPICGTVDPAIASASLVSSAGNEWVFDLTIQNNGAIPSGYFRLSAYDGSPAGTLIRERVIKSLAAGESRLHRFTFPQVQPNGFVNVKQGKVYFVFDQASVIAESNESNNAAIGYLPACTDADGDGWAYECISCYNAHCPLRDCWDGSASVNPDAVEGPYGSAVCSDVIDNDCDSTIDLGDTGCQPPPLTVTAVSETTSSGTKTGSYLSTKAANEGAYENLTEAGSKHTLVHTWRIDNVLAGASHDLLIKGSRISSTDGDNFQFSYSTTGNKFTLIPNAVINNAREPLNPMAFPFATGALSGTVYIRITDTAGGAINDTVAVDYVAIRTNP